MRRVELTILAAQLHPRLAPCTFVKPMHAAVDIESLRSSAGRLGEPGAMLVLHSGVRLQVKESVEEIVERLKRPDPAEASS